MKGITDQTLATKRDAQDFIGLYIEAAFKSGLTEKDTVILSAMCPPVTTTLKEKAEAEKEEKEGEEGEGEEGEEEEDEEEEDEEDETDGNFAGNKGDAPYKGSYAILLGHIYSRKTLPKTVISRQVQKLVERAAELQVALPARRQWTEAYSTNELLSSASKQLFREIKRMYVSGSKSIEKKVRWASSRTRYMPRLIQN